MDREHAGQLVEARPCQATAAPLEAPAPRASSLPEIATPDPLGVMSHLMGTMSPEQLQEVLKGLQESGTSIVPTQVTVIRSMCTSPDCHHKWSIQSVVSSAAVCCNCDMDTCLAQHKHYAFTNGFGACCCSVFKPYDFGCMTVHLAKTVLFRNCSATRLWTGMLRLRLPCSVAAFLCFTSFLSCPLESDALRNSKRFVHHSGKRLLLFGMFFKLGFMTAGVRVNEQAACSSNGA